MAVAGGGRDEGDKYGRSEEQELSHVGLSKAAVFAHISVMTSFGMIGSRIHTPHGAKRGGQLQVQYTNTRVVVMH